MASDRQRRAVAAKFAVFLNLLRENRDFAAIACWDHRCRRIFLSHRAALRKYAVFQQPEVTSVHGTDEGIFTVHFKLPTPRPVIAKLTTSRPAKAGYLISKYLLRVMINNLRSLQGHRLVRRLGYQFENGQVYLNWAPTWIRRDLTANWERIGHGYLMLVVDPDLTFTPEQLAEAARHNNDFLEAISWNSVAQVCR